MTDRRPAARPAAFPAALRGALVGPLLGTLVGPLLGALVGALLAGLAPAPAEARPGVHHHGRPPVRRVVRVRPVPVVPSVPPPVLVRDYLPRNLGVPMYNEPPRRRTLDGPAW
jgi:hypothetical protein